MSRPFAHKARPSARLTMILLAASLAPITATTASAQITIPTPATQHLITGVAADGRVSGEVLGSAGDFNGDGFEDLVVGTPYADGSESSEGRAYIVFGNSTVASSDLDTLLGASQAIEIAPVEGGTVGFQLVGSSVVSYESNCGCYPIVAVGAPRWQGNRGAVFLAFGSTAPTNLALPDFTSTEPVGARGAMILGPDGVSKFGQSVSTGDVDGDGAADLIIGAPSDYGNKGGVYVVFGNVALTGANSISDLMASSQAMFIQGAAVGSQFGYRVSAAGDVTGDAIDDILIGAFFENSGEGAAYLAFGPGLSGHGATVGVGGFDNGTGGFSMRGRAANAFTGAAVVIVDDMNGDGISELAVGAPTEFTGGVPRGAAYVVFGKSGSRSGISFASTNYDVDGFVRIVGVLGDGGTGASYSGLTLESAGDFNNDGAGDLLIGAPAASSGQVGAAYVLFGITEGPTFGQSIALDALAPSSPRGFLISPEVPGEVALLGRAASGPVYFNGNAYPDFAIGAPNTDFPAGIGTEGLTAIYSQPENTADATYRVQFANDTARRTFGASRATITSSAPQGALAGVTVYRDNSFLSVDLDPNFILKTAWAVDGFPIIGRQGGIELKYSDDELKPGMDESRLIVMYASASNTPAIRLGGAFLDPLKNNIEAEFVGNGVYMIVDPRGIPQFGRVITDVQESGGALGFTLTGASTNERTGSSVSAIGDINGDGFDDLIAGSPGRFVPPYQYGAVHTVLAEESQQNLTTLAPEGGINGFATFTDKDFYSFGQDSAALGDINGDGLDDYAVNHASRYSENDGEVLVFFGQTSTNPPVLSDIRNGTGGFVITNSNSRESATGPIVRGGDINNDGFPDLIISAEYNYSYSYSRNSSKPTRNGGSYTPDGGVYVVFGKTDTAPVDLTDVALGTGGFKIYDYSGKGSSSFANLISGGFDVTGDGFDDVIVGNPFGVGAVVVEGRVNTEPVDIGPIMSGAGGGFAILDVGSRNTYLSAAVASIGDTNGDGFGDVALTGRDNAYTSVSFPGKVYVVFGRSDATALDVSELESGTGGYTVRGEDQRDSLGRKLSAAGDDNSDGLMDFAIGAPLAGDDARNIYSSGAVYVVHGNAAPPTVLEAVTLNDNPTLGKIWVGEDTYSTLGGALADGGDLNGDGFTDIAIGSQNYGYGGKAGRPSRNGGRGGYSRTGRAYVIFGTATGAVSDPATYYAKVGPGDIAKRPIGASRALVGIDANTSETLVSVAIQRSKAGIDTLPLNRTANVLWQVSLNGGGTFTSLPVTFEYTQAEVDGLVESSLRLMIADSPSGPWVPVSGATVNQNRNMVSADAPAAGYFALLADSVLAVELESFGAERVVLGNIIKWKTTSEIDSVGFFVRKGTRQPNGSIQLGPRLGSTVLPSQGGGSSYEVTDPSGGENALYYLEEIDVSGKQSYFGPVSPATRNASVGEWNMF